MTTETRSRKSTLSKITKLFTADSTKHSEPPSSPKSAANNTDGLNNNTALSDPQLTTRSSSNSSHTSIRSSSSSSLQQLSIDFKKLPHLSPQLQPQPQPQSQLPSRISSKTHNNHSNDKIPSIPNTPTTHLSRSSSTVSHKQSSKGTTTSNIGNTLKPVTSSNSIHTVSQTSANTSLKNQARFIVFEDGTHEHHLRNAKRQEKLTHMFKNLLNNNKLRDSAVSAVPDILNSGPPSLFSGLINQQNCVNNDTQKYLFSGATGVPEVSNPVTTTPSSSVQPMESSNSNSNSNSNHINNLSTTNNQTFVERYGRCQEVVGKGTFGVVRISHKKGKNSDCEKLFAVKEFKKKPNEDALTYSKRLTSEFCISSSLKHVNIIETLDLLQDAKGDYVEVMEFCSGGDLYTLIIATGKLEYLEADCFFKQLIRGVNYMHEMGITHRDLKPENLLLTSNGCLKITDFGNGECFKMAWENEIHLSNGICGSSPYIAPEEYVSKEFDPRLIDIWSCGVIYMAMRTGRHLWKEANVKDEFYRKYLDDRKCSKGYEPIELIKRARCRNVIYSILDPIPSRRINGKQILKSEWGREIKCCV